MNDKAKEFAIAAHGDQQKYGKHPYSKHLQDVVSCSQRFGLSESIQTAAWLHDVVEDTPVTVDEIREEFGEEIAKLVDAVTDEPGSNRKERHQKTYPKTRNAGADAIALKLCDRIANVEAVGKMKMYRKEYPEFRRMLYRKGELEELWNHLDDLFVEKKEE